MISLICQECKPNILDVERIDTLSWITPMNAEWILWGDMLSSFDESVEMDNISTLDWTWSVFTWDYGGVEDN